MDRRGLTEPFRTDPAPLRPAADRVAHRICENGAKSRYRQHQRGRGRLFNHEASKDVRQEVGRDGGIRTRGPQTPSLVR
jgi:hypothetical protein